MERWNNCGKEGWEGKGGRDMTLVIVWRAFTVFIAFMHFILLCVRRHVRALKFPRLACMPNLYCISRVFGD